MDWGGDMALLPVSKAAGLVGISRKTMYAHIKSGKVSASKGGNKTLLIDTSELIRVFGDIALTQDTEGNKERQLMSSDFDSVLLERMEQMSRQIESLTEKVVELQKQLALPAPVEQKKGFLNWLFGKIER